MLHINNYLKVSPSQQSAIKSQTRKIEAARIQSWRDQAIPTLTPIIQHLRPSGRVMVRTHRYHARIVYRPQEFKIQTKQFRIHTRHILHPFLAVTI
ncbi:MAG: hypothetical protein ACUVTM_03710 [Candidatus Bathyarchaeia archaeon]